MNVFERYKKPLQFVLFAALTAVLLRLAFKDIEWTALWTSILSANYAWLIVANVISIAAYFVRAQRWRLLIEPLGYTSSLHNTYNAVIIGYLANFAFPRLGEAARCGALTRSNAIPFDKLVGTVVTERLFDLICLILLLIIAIAASMDTFGRFLHDAANETLLHFHLSAILIYVVVIVALVVTILVFLFVYKKHTRFVQKLQRFLKGIVEGFVAFRKMRCKWKFLAWTAALWCCYWTMSWLMLYAISGWEHFSAADGLLVMLLGSFGVIAPANGGLGSFHAVIKYGMPILFGVSAADALSYAVLSHESQSLIIFILGIVAYVRVFVRRKTS
jgi:uncharacterized protein (TIRG00374 family)